MVSKKLGGGACEVAPVGVSVEPERGGFPRESASLIEIQPKVCDQYPGVSPPSTREPLKDDNPPGGGALSPFRSSRHPLPDISELLEGI